MEYLVQETDPNIITVTYSGNVDLNQRKSAVSETCRLLNQSDFVGLLVDVTKMSLQMTLDEQKHFAEYLSSKKELAKAKVAILHSPLSNPNSLINAVAYANGFSSVDFNNKSEAIAWLNGDLR